MREAWKADIVRDLYRYEITRDRLAKEMGVSVSYVNMILAGSRKGESAGEKMREAVSRIMARRAEDRA